MDIASNDGTLLNSYKIKGIKTVGIDPILKNIKNFIKINIKIPSFFSRKALKKVKSLKISNYNSMCRFLRY